jgi:short-subunit dehydrogenase
MLVDLGDDDEFSALADRLARMPPDLLINVAGIMRFGLHESQPADALAACYRINLLVPALLARAVAGPMRVRRSGQIVNVGSVLGAIPYPWFAAYSSSKAGLAALSDALRRELEGTGVTVTHVNPRAARTAFNTGKVARFLEIAGMTLDEPEWVANIVVEAILARRETVTIGFMERIYAALNVIAPRLIDKGLAGQVRRARAEFTVNSQEANNEILACAKWRSACDGAEREPFIRLGPVDERTG